jgi:hypothetical protein
VRPGAYLWKLSKANGIYTFSEILIIVGSATSGVSGWAIWTYGITKDVWLVIAAAATLLTAVKPIFQMNKKIERYTKLYSGHNMNYLSMKDIVQRISETHEISPEIEREYKQLHSRYLELARDEDPHRSKRLVERFTSEVLIQIPAERLWWPE